MSDIKLCPFCKEEIKKDAIRCKHCGEDLPVSQTKEAIAVKKKNDIQVSPKVLLWIFLGIASLFFWFITIPGVVIWYIWKKPKLRAKLNEYLRTTAGMLKRHWKVITPVIAVLLIIVGIRNYNAPRAAAIEINDKYEFIGNNVEIAGKVSVSCPCILELSINGKPVQMDGGLFKTALDVPSGTDTGRVEVAVKVTGGSFNPKTLVTKAESVFQRKIVPIDPANIALETGDGKYELILHGLPNSIVNIKGADEKMITLDGNGSGSILMGFNTAYNVKTTKYTLTAKAEGYASGTKEIEVKNLKYDDKRVAADQEKEQKKIAADLEKEQKRLAAETEKNRIQGLIDNMQYYEGNGDIQVAVNGKPVRSNCVSYSCVNDPKNYSYVRIGIAVKNVSNDVIHANPLYITIQDGSGRTYTHESETYSLGNYFDAVNLQPGSYTDGWLAFILPREHEFLLIYASNDGAVAKKIYVP